jgi:hypothetical protein
LLAEAPDEERVREPSRASLLGCSAACRRYNCHRRRVRGTQTSCTTPCLAATVTALRCRLSLLLLLLSVRRRGRLETSTLCVGFVVASRVRSRCLRRALGSVHGALRVVMPALRAHVRRTSEHARLSGQLGARLRGGKLGGALRRRQAPRLRLSGDCASRHRRCAVHLQVRVRDACRSARAGGGYTGSRRRLLDTPRGAIRQVHIASSQPTAHVSVSGRHPRRRGLRRATGSSIRRRIRSPCLCMLLGVNQLGVCERRPATTWRLRHARYWFSCSRHYCCGCTPRPRR